MKKEKATLLKGRSKQKKTMNVYFLTKAPKSSTFFVVKSFSKKKIDSVECNEKRLDIYHEVDAPFTRQLLTEFKLKLNLRLFDRDWLEI